MAERRVEIMQSPLTSRWYAVRVTREATGEQRGRVQRIADVTDSVNAILAADRAHPTPSGRAAPEGD